MRVRFTNAHGSYKPGQIAELPDDQARKLVKAGGAEEYQDDPDAPVRLRFRRGASIGGKSVAAGAVESFEQSDEVWEAVNRGDADLDPPPGEPLGNARQPFPPDFTQRDETTDAPAVPPVVTAQPAAPQVKAATPPPENPTRQPAESKSAGEANPPAPETLNKDPHVKPQTGKK